ncbi:hypothetical protein VTJ83DRAFT_5910 [Remersonia thermophila]|uniref:ATP synthase subunit e, mitochondrial n=1 Tax=Remersonia thermophila TaxID=72144 RepID=A0ABR4D864_9PEZI
MHPLAARPCRRAPPTSSLVYPQIRKYSAQQHPPSATGAFYKNFTRPVAKCALLGVFVYQLVYFGWTKLETEEIKRDKQAEIIKLEAKVKALQAAQEAERAASAASDRVGANGEAREGKGGSSWWRW